MELLVIILSLPLAIYAHRYRISADPNDAPFLPIFPVFPYSPKLMKRGVERDHPPGQINPQLYAPKPDARDTYSTNYNVNYQRDHTSTPAQSIHQAAYTAPTLTNQAYTPSTSYTPGSSVASQYYNVNPYIYAIYNGYPVTLVTQAPPHKAKLSNNYLHQQQYQQYYPDYHQTYSSNGGSQSSQESDGKSFGKLQDLIKNKLNIKDGPFVEGTHFLTNHKDNDVSTGTYNIPGQLNQENDNIDSHLRSPQQSRQMFQIVQYDGQHFRPSNYAVTSGYKYQQLDQQLVNQALGKIFGSQGVTNSVPTQYDVSQVNSIVSEKMNGHITNAPVIAKTGLAYVMNPSFTIAPRHIGKVSDNYQSTDSSIGLNIRGQKPVTTVTVEGSHGLYIPPTKLYKSPSKLTEYSDFTPPSGQIYEDPIDYKKIGPNYLMDAALNSPTIQPYQYQYSRYQSGLNNQQSLDGYKVTLDDVNSASKRSS